MKKQILLIVLPFCSISCFSQSTEYPPLFRFLQNNYDTTVIYFPWSSWNGSANFYILGRKDNNISVFRYQRPFNRFSVQKENKDSVRYLDSIFTKSSVDSNMFLKRVPLKPVQGDSLWRYLISNSLFKLKDDTDFGGGCFKIDSTKNCYIYDSGIFDFYLITKKEIRILHYYAPDYFEEKCCPGIKDRKTIIEIITVFYKAFQSAGSH